MPFFFDFRMGDQPNGLKAQFSTLDGVYGHF